MVSVTEREAESTTPHCRADPNRSIINAKSVNREITNRPPKLGKSSGDGNDPFVINPGPRSWHAVEGPRVRSTTSWRMKCERDSWLL